MLQASPDDPRLHLALAMEYEKEARWDVVADHLRRYLELAEDEGNAYGRLGNALRHLGEDAEARQAYEHGTAAAYRHGHPTMAQEFEEVIADWES